MKMSASAQTLLVIPTYNECENLERLIEAVCREQDGIQILVIDDNSPDGTGKIADRLAAQGRVHVIHRSGKLGIGSAHKAGLRYAIEHQFAYVMTMDGDFSHSPADLRPLLERAAFVDAVIGSRYVQGGGFERFGAHRLALTKTVHWLTQVLLQLPYDCTGGLRLYRVAALQRIPWEALRADGHAFLIEVLFHLQQQGGTIHEYPITIHPRRFGKSKVSLAELGRAASILARLWWMRMMLARLDHRARVSQDGGWSG